MISIDTPLPAPPPTSSTPPPPSGGGGAISLEVLSFLALALLLNFGVRFRGGGRPQPMRRENGRKLG